MDAKKNKGARGRRIMQLIHMAAYVLTGVILVAWRYRTGGGFIYVYAALFLMLPLIRCVDIAIHELGHLLGGLLSGYRFVWVQIAGLTVSRREDGRLRMGRMTTPGESGACMMEPPELKDGKMPYLLFGAGGVLANFIAAAGFGAAACFVDEPTVWMICLAFAVWNAEGMLISGIPFSCNIENDARNILEMSRSDEAVGRIWRAQMISAQMFRGVPYKDMPEEWFPMPADEELLSSTLAADEAVRYYHWLAGQDRDEEANRLADRLLEEGALLSDSQRATLRVNRAFYEMMQGVRTQEECKAIADQWLDEPTKRYISALGSSPSGLRVQFALAMLVKGHTYKADQIEEEYDEAVKKDIRVRDPERDKEYFRKVREAYARRKGTAEEIHR